MSASRNYDRELFLFLSSENNFGHSLFCTEIYFGMKALVPCDGQKNGIVHGKGLNVEEWWSVIEPQTLQGNEQPSSDF